jgi:KDO2-lipid IV(A) lauroyltransferase
LIAYLLLRLGGLLVRLLPTRLAYFLFARVGDLAWGLLRRKRAAAIENSARVLGPARAPEAPRVARETFRNYARYIADFTRFPSLTRERISRIVYFNQAEQLNGALARGKGVLFVGLHLGNWDLAAAYLAERYPVSVIVDFVETDAVNGYVERTRAAKGVKTIPYAAGARGALAALRRNEIVGLLIDVPTPDGVVVDFFGAPVAVPAGPARLALKTGATLLVGALVRLGEDKYLGHIDSVPAIVPTGDPNEDVRALTQAIMTALEEYATRYPEQLIMFRRLWLNQVRSSEFGVRSSASPPNSELRTRNS